MSLHSWKEKGWEQEECSMVLYYLSPIGPDLGSNGEKIMQNGLEILFLSLACGA